MAISHHTYNLVKAIEGYMGATSKQPELKDIHEKLAQARDEALSGHTFVNRSSPGKKQADDVAAKAFQREHPSELRHDVHGGQRESNLPGGAREGEPGPEVFGPLGDKSDKIAAAARPAPSQDNLRFNPPGNRFTEADAQIRRIAADRELARTPGGKMPETNIEQPRGGQSGSIAKAPPAPPSDRVGRVRGATEILGTREARPRGGEVARAGAEAREQLEEKPPYAGEDITSKDGWQRLQARHKLALQKAGARRG